MTINTRFSSSTICNFSSIYCRINISLVIERILLMNFVLLITKSDLYNDLYQEINRQNTFYFWIVGIVVTVSIAIAAFIGILQWRLSDKQIQKMKESTKQELEEKFHFSETINKVNHFDDRLRTLENKLSDLETIANGNKQDIKDIKHDQQDYFVDSIVSGVNSHLDNSNLNASMQKINLESKAFEIAYTTDKEKSRTAVNNLKTEIDNIMTSKIFEEGNMLTPLAGVYRSLNNSNNDDAIKLANYLKKKYPLAISFIKLS